MTNLGKWVAVAGGVLVVLFGLIGWIVVVASDFATGGTKAHAVIQGLILMVLGGAIAVGAGMMYDKAATAICWVAAATVVLALAATSGGMSFYVVLGGLAAIIGANWEKCGGKAVTEQLTGGQEEERVVFTAPPPPVPPAASEPVGGQAPPESRL